VTWAVYQENTVDVEGRGPSPAVHSSLELDTPRSRRIIHVCPAQPACSEQSEKHCYTTCERIPCMSRDVMAGGLCRVVAVGAGVAGGVVWLVIHACCSAAGIAGDCHVGGPSSGASALRLGLGEQHHPPASEAPLVAGELGDLGSGSLDAAPRQAPRFRFGSDRFAQVFGTVG
jgi:hypothetical protein